MLKGIFSGTNGKLLMRMCGHFVYNRDNHVLLATTTILLDVKYEFYGSGGDLIEINN